MLFFLGSVEDKLTKLNGKDRMWRLEFSIASEYGYPFYSCPGSWYISLYLLESSPPTCIDCSLIIPEAITPSTNHRSDHVNSSVSASSRIQLPPIVSNSRPIEMRLQSTQLDALRSRWPLPNCVIFILQDSLTGDKL